jgi:hypothetical protein
MPRAVVPLWQVAQACVVLEWSNVAPWKVTVLVWHVSQDAVVCM